MVVLIPGSSPEVTASRKLSRQAEAEAEVLDRHLSDYPLGIQTVALLLYFLL